MARGGARPGAGRKTKAEKYATAIARAERQIVDQLPDVVENLLHLADGGYERVRETYKPVGLIYIEQPALDADGVPRIDANGRPMMARTLAFPELAAEDPAQMVCVERTTEIADKDRAANIYLVDRILGKPTQQTEITGKDGGPIESAVFTLEQWQQQAATRLATAAATFAALDETSDGGSNA